MENVHTTAIQRLIALPERDLVALHRLNGYLRQAELQIWRATARIILENRNTSLPANTFDESDGSSEINPITVVIAYRLHKKHFEFEVRADHIVAWLEAKAVPIPGEHSPLRQQVPDQATIGSELRELKYCELFIDLLLHLESDWNRVLRISSLKAKISLYKQTHELCFLKLHTLD